MERTRLARWMKSWLTAGLLSLVVACGASDDAAAPAAESAAGPATEIVEVDAALRADAPTRGEWRARAGQMSFWLRTSLEPTHSRGRTYWIMRGRTSRPLRHVRAHDRDGYHYISRMRSTRTFELPLSDREVLRLLAGKRIFFEFLPETGKEPVYHGMAIFGARFADWKGSSKIFVYRAINPIYLGHALRFRGRVKTADGWFVEDVFTDDDTDPLTTWEPDTLRLDWTPDALLLAADPAEDRVYFTAVDSDDRRVSKSAEIHLRIATLGLTTENPWEVWPPESCRPEVETCLNALDPADFDTETCGWANEVEACFQQVTSPLAATPERFVDDLAAELEVYYAHHGQSVDATGGNDLEAALALLDPGEVQQVDDWERGAYYHHDPRYYTVLYHPDVIHPGSARIWYGVYEPSGRRVALYAVNDGG